MGRAVDKNVLVGYKCNNRCRHCLLGHNDERNCFERSYSEIKEILVESKREGIRAVVLTGGEVTIRKDFFEILDFIKSLDLRLHIDSNGRSFSTDDFTRRALETMPDMSVMISIHSCFPETHDDLTGVVGSFNQTVEGIRKLKNYGIKRISVDCVVSRLNYQQLPRISSFFSELGIDEAHFTLMRLGRNSWNIFSELFISPKEIEPYLIEALRISRSNGLIAKTYGFPYCALRGCESHSYEIKFLENYLKDETYIFDEPEGRIDWQDLRLSLKGKIPSCKFCGYNRFCEGIWKEYLVGTPHGNLTPVSAGIGII
jgi:MoaA/NifB/PqqE/SkfB family radical SAM enzyme